MSKIVSITKNNEGNFRNKAESIMLEKMTFLEKKRYQELKSAISNLDVNSLKKALLFKQDYIYQEKFVDKVIEVYNPIKSLLNNLNEDNFESVIEILDLLNKNKDEQKLNLISKKELSDKNLRNKLNMSFMEKIVEKNKINLFKQIIKDLNQVDIFNKKSELMFDLLKRKAKREKENNKEKNKIRPIK